jgi:hypothetical protein
MSPGVEVRDTPAASIITPHLLLQGGIAGGQGRGS